jgi:hypothetical protein
MLARVRVQVSLKSSDPRGQEAHLLRRRIPVDAFRARAAELAPGVRIEVLAPDGSLELDG